ncbi:hypothetical protein [Polaromonas sp. AER18D-145]|uniref:hypothetical protein n=1 Tax=Polaromonas sp. AER18D-145 TaxID=1977060 RepID=UPI001F0A221C|nr:hypothetical protein [Polaromonas sp. AER18D-145]
MSLEEPPDDKYANAEEICEAIETLTEEELVRINSAAKYALFGTEYTDPLELLDEAIVRALEGADGGTGRHWPKTVHFVAFLIMTIHSIADGSSDSIVQKRTDHLEVMAGESGGPSWALAHEGYFNCDAEEQALEIEESELRRERAKADANLIEAHFAEDDEIQYLIMGDKDGMKAQEIRDISGMSQKSYDTARRRFRRGLDKLMPGRRTV